MILDEKTHELLLQEWKKRLTMIRDECADPSFPRCCDSISKAMLLLIWKQKLFSDCQVFYVRGHYVAHRVDKILSPTDSIDCREYQSYLTRLHHSDMWPQNAGLPDACHNCSCHEVYQHSYIEVLGEEHAVILDFSAYQFSSDFHGQTNVSELVRLKHYLLNPMDKHYGCYVPTQERVPLNEIIIEIIRNAAQRSSSASLPHLKPE